MFKTLLAAFLVATPLFAGDAIFTLSDPRGDDYGTGTLKYPMSADFQQGDLDLLSVRAIRVDGGTQFEAKFARPIRQPERRTVDGIGTQLNDLAKLGFYTFNLDIYIDTDGVAGSGSTTTLPGRGVMIDPSTAWEKVISLTPDPMRARSELKRIVVRDERRRGEAEGRKVVSDDTKTELQSSVDDFVFFPTQVRVTGNTISFFVPSSFIAEPKSDWSYVIAVTGADVAQRLDQQNRLMRMGDSGESLMVLPVSTGRPVDRFGGAIERDDYMPPLVDVIVPAGDDQKKVLSNYDTNAERAAVLKGVKP
jgi:hypothetical protein